MNNRMKALDEDWNVRCKELYTQLDAKGVQLMRCESELNNLRAVVEQQEAMLQQNET